MNTSTHFIGFRNTSKQIAAFCGGYSKTLFTFLILFLSCGVWGQTYTDNATSYSGSWANNSNNSSPTGGFGNWTISPGANSGVFIGNPSGDGMGTTGIGTTAFAMYATGSGYCSASRGVSGGMQVGDKLTFYWAMNYDAGAGSKGFDLKSNNTTIFNVNNTGSATITTTNGQAFTAYGTTPMLVSVIRISSSSYSFNMSARDGGTAYSTTISSSSSIDLLNFYIGNQNNSAGQKNIYFNAFSLIKPQYRSKATGNWDTASTWEISTDGGVSWGNASSAPNSIYDKITIQNIHTVTLTSDITVNTIIINGTLNCLNYTLNIASSGLFTNNGTFTQGTGTVNFVGAGTVNGTVATTFKNLTMNSGTITISTAPTLDGVLTINGGALSAAPKYTANSTLFYNSTYTRYNEWNAIGVGTLGTTAGYPNHVTINLGTFTVLNGDAGTARAMAGNLTVNTGATFTTGALTSIVTVGGNLITNGTGSVSMSSTNSNLNVSGDISNQGSISLSTATGRLKATNLTNTGTITLSSAIGGDLELTGNLIDNATFNANSRAIFFTGSGVQDVSGTGVFNIDYIVSSKSAGRIRMLTDLLCEGPNGGNAITLTNSTDILDLNGYSLTLGKSGVSSNFSGSGSIRTNLNSNIVIAGNFNTNSIKFDQTNPGTTNVLKNLTLNANSSVTLGNALNITAGSTPGVLSLGASATLTTGGNLTLKSDTNGTARVSEVGAGGSITGNVTVERYIPGKRAWRALTAPLKGSTNNSIFYNWQNNGSVSSGVGVELWGPGGTGSAGNNTSTSGLSYGPGTSIKQYGNGWSDVTDTKTTSLFTSNGNNAYMVFVTGGYGSGNISSGFADTTLKSTGQLITGSVSYTGLSSTYHTLIGNPYACPIHPSSIVNGATNLFTNVWVWDPALGTNGGYVNYDGSLGAGTYSSSGGSYPNNTIAIQSGQAFFVRAASGTGSLTLTESMKSSSISNTFRNSNSNMASIFRVGFLKQTATDWMPLDGCIAGFYEGANAEADEADGKKMINTGENIGFLRNAVNLSSEHYPLVTTQDIMYLKVWNTQQAHYKLKLNTEEFTMVGVEAYLQDLYTGTSQQLNLDGSVQDYEFDVDPTVSASSGNRFRIVFTNTALAVTHPEQGQLSIYPNPATGGKVTVSLPTGSFEGCSYELINVLGQVVREDQLENGTSSQVSIPITGLPNSWYALRIIKENSVVYQGKLIIKN